MIMKFDISWFTTIPGILITCGVVLLILALIIFIVTSKKNKKDENKEEVKEEKLENVAQAKDVAAPAAPIEIDNAPLQDISSSSNNMAVPIELPAEPIPVQEPAVTTKPIVGAAELPVMGVTPTPVVEPTSVPVAEPTPVPVVEPTPVPVVEPTPAPVAEPTPAPVVEPTPAPVVEPIVAPASNEKPAIYGGVSQIIPSIDLKKKEEHQIYGGADPLENTQTLSVTPAVAEAPKVEVSTIPSVTPTAEPAVSIIPSVSSTSAEPVVEPVDSIDSLMP
jgi:hypothetical protein